jgi:hypothetical protein
MRGNQVIFPKTRAVRNLYRTVEESGQTPTGGTYNSRQSVIDGQEEFYWETSIDWAALEQVAMRAAKNKSGKAKEGPLQVRIIERRKLKGGN